MLIFIYISFLFITIMLCSVSYINGKKQKKIYTLLLFLNIYQLLSIIGHFQNDINTDFFSYPLSYWIGYLWASNLSVIISFIIFFKNPSEDLTLNNNALMNNKDDIILQFMKQSNLSKPICIDIYNILISFLNNDSEDAYNKIEHYLIPHLKENNSYGDVGIAFGMLIGDEALSKDEALSLSNKIISEMVEKNKLRENK